MFIQNKIVRDAGIRVYSAASGVLHRERGRKLLVVSFPKSGTHLATSLLKEVPGISLSYKHFRVPDYSKERDRVGPARLDCNKIMSSLASMKGGQVATCHFPYDQSLSETLNAEGVGVVFVTRDLRDVVISQVNYIMKLKRHPLHNYFVKDLATFEERVRACLYGVHNIDRVREPHGMKFSSKDLPSLRDRIESYRRWRSDGVATTVTFEDLVGARGGGEEDAQFNATEAMVRASGIEVSREDIVRAIASASRKSSATLYKGVQGVWRERLNEQLKREFERELDGIL